MNVLLAENIFWTFYHPKPQLLQLSASSTVMIWRKKRIINSFWMNNFKKNQILKQVFTKRQTLNQEFLNMSDFQSTLNNSSFLESEFIQHVKFWNIFLTQVRFWSEKLTIFLQRLRLLKKHKKLLVKVWIDFHIASELESRCLQRISFRWKKCC